MPAAGRNARGRIEHVGKQDVCAHRRSACVDVREAPCPRSSGAAAGDVTENGGIGLFREALGWLAGEVWHGKRQRDCMSADIVFCCAGWGTRWCVVMSGCSTTRFTATATSPPSSQKSSAPIPERGGVSGQAIVCARWQFDPQERIPRWWSAIRYLSVAAKHDADVTGCWYSSLANNIQAAALFVPRRFTRVRGGRTAKNSASSNVCSAASMAGTQCRRPVVTLADRYGSLAANQNSLNCRC